MSANFGLLLGTDNHIKDILKSRVVLNKYATNKLMNALYPDEQLEISGESHLADVYQIGNAMLAGCFRDVVIVASKKFRCEPQRIDSVFINAINKKYVYQIVMVDSADWLVFAKWEHGKPIRMLSVAPDSGIKTDEGNKLPCEKPYWQGLHNPNGDEAASQAVPNQEVASEEVAIQEVPSKIEEQENSRAEVYPLPFHPSDLGEAILKNEFGFQFAAHHYQIKSQVDSALPNPSSIPLYTYKSTKSWWKVW